MSTQYEFELAKAARILTEELLALKKGEIFVITADTMSDMRVVNATAAAAYAAGAKPMVILTATPPGPARMVDDFLPSDALKAALQNADAWVEFNFMYLLYSDISLSSFKQNKRLREIVLPCMSDDVFIRMFANTDHNALKDFMECITGKTEKASKIRFTSATGMDVTFNNMPGWPISCDTGYASTPGVHQLSGQIGWEPDFDSVNGVIVFDGSLVPQIGIVDEPVRVYMEKGTIVKIEGGAKAREWDSFLRGFDDPQMLRVSHVCYGFHPNAKLSGFLGEDERVWGCTQWGFGSIGPCPLYPDGLAARSHSDGVSLNTSIWLDDMQITDKGVMLDPELIRLAAKLGKK